MKSRWNNDAVLAIPSDTKKIFSKDHVRDGHCDCDESWFYMKVPAQGIYRTSQ